MPAMKILDITLLIYLNAVIYTADSKIYSRCELVSELNIKYSIPVHEVSDWICILFWESGFDTKAYRVGNFDGSYNFGLFQINDLLWCHSLGRKNNTNFCDSPCDKYRDHDISDDLKCALLIYKMQGFSAWGAYNSKCRKDTSAYIDGCNIDKQNSYMQSVIYNQNNGTDIEISADNDLKQSFVKQLVEIVSKTSMTLPHTFFDGIKRKRSIGAKEWAKRVGERTRVKRAFGGHDSYNPFEDARVFVFNPLCCFGWKAADVEWSNMKNMGRDIRTTLFG